MKFIDKIKLKIKIRQVEKRVLHYKLYKWQKDVILNGFWWNNNVPWGKRASGKTLAYDLYFILNPTFGIDVVRCKDQCLEDEPSLMGVSTYRKWHIQHMILLYNGIKNKGIKVREIKLYDK